MRDCVRKVLRHEGVRAFYKGLLPSLVSLLQSIVRMSWGQNATCAPTHQGSEQQSQLPASWPSPPTLKRAVPHPELLKQHPTGRTLLPPSSQMLRSLPSAACRSESSPTLEWTSQPSSS